MSCNCMSGPGCMCHLRGNYVPYMPQPRQTKYLRDTSEFQELETKILEQSMPIRCITKKL